MKDKGRGVLKPGLFRREFLKVTGTFAAVAAASCAKPGAKGTGRVMTDGIESEYPVCQGYIVVDAKKCQGCLTCMLVCSLVHHGAESLSLSRIQIIQDSFKPFPEDILIEPCRQCVDPECVAMCPEEALRVDAEHGNVRLVDASRCIGCSICVDACPHPPGRVIWNFEEGLAEKCGLCVDAPFWEGGGPGGRQACREVCPMKAIAFQEAVPAQEGEAGYEANLRGEAWKEMGYPVD